MLKALVSAVCPALLEHDSLVVGIMAHSVSRFDSGSSVKEKPTEPVTVESMFSPL